MSYYDSVIFYFKSSSIPKGVWYNFINICSKYTIKACKTLSKPNYLNIFMSFLL